MNEWAWWNKISATYNFLSDQLIVRLPDEWENKKIKLQLHDVSGKILLQNDYVVRNKSVDTYLGNISNGAYFIKITSETFEKTLKFIKH